MVRPLWRREVAFAPGQIRDDEQIESLGVGVDRYAAINIPALLLGEDRSPTFLRQVLSALAAILPRIDSVVILARQGHLGPQFTPGKDAHAMESLARRASAKPSHDGSQGNA